MLTPSHESHIHVYVNRCWEEWILTLMEDFVGLETLAKEVSADMVETARELEVEPEMGLHGCNLLPRLGRKRKKQRMLSGHRIYSW